MKKKYHFTFLQQYLYDNKFLVVEPCVGQMSLQILGILALAGINIPFYTCTVQTHFTSLLQTFSFSLAKHLQRKGTKYYFFLYFLLRIK